MSDDNKIASKEFCTAPALWWLQFWGFVTSVSRVCDPSLCISHRGSWRSTWASVWSPPPPSTPYSECERSICSGRSASSPLTSRPTAAQSPPLYWSVRQNLTIFEKTVLAVFCLRSIFFCLRLNTRQKRVEDQHRTVRVQPFQSFWCLSDWFSGLCSLLSLSPLLKLLTSGVHINCAKIRYNALQRHEKSVLQHHLSILAHQRFIVTDLPATASTQQTANADFKY